VKKKLVCALVLLSSVGAMANEYEKDNVTCTISGDKQSISDSKSELANKIEISFKAVSIEGKSKINGHTDVEVKKTFGYYKTAPFNNPELLNKIVSALKVEKKLDTSRSISWYKLTRMQLPNYSSYTTSSYTVKIKDSAKKGKTSGNGLAQEILEELGNEAVDVSASENFSGKKLELKDNTNDGKGQKTQIHYPIKGEYDGLSYHIKFNCKESRSY
jgi:hypothetical protein